jgi:hypothetical protein
MNSVVVAAGLLGSLSRPAAAQPAEVGGDRTGPLPIAHTSFVRL